MGVHSPGHPHTYVSFFAGIGGLDHAVNRVFLDARPIVYVENEVAAGLRLARQVEAERLHAAPIWSDVTTFPTGEFRGRTDMAIGGFPCTDISNAGKRAGINGERSGLFYHLVRTSRALGCRYLFLENVSAIVARSNLDAVLGELAELGYDARWGCLRASDVGAPHGRNRWWCLAWDREQLADAVSGRHDGRPSEPWRGPLNGAAAARDGAEACCLPHWPPGPADRDGWATILSEYPHLAPAVESTVCGVVDAGSGRHRTDVHMPCECNRGDRLRGLGNAVVPDCAEAALRLLWCDAFGERV